MYYIIFHILFKIEPIMLSIGSSSDTRNMSAGIRVLELDVRSGEAYTPRSIGPKLIRALLSTI